MMSYNEPTSGRSFSLEQAVGGDPSAATGGASGTERQIGQRAVRISRLGAGSPTSSTGSAWSWQERPDLWIMLDSFGISDAELEKIVVSLRPATKAEWNQLMTPPDVTATTIQACPDRPKPPDVPRVLPAPMLLPRNGRRWSSHSAETESNQRFGNRVSRPIETPAASTEPALTTSTF